MKPATTGFLDGTDWVVHMLRFISCTKVSISIETANSFASFSIEKCNLAGMTK